MKPYLKTRSYQRIKNIYKNGEHYECWICKIKDNLNLHHLHYNTIGREDGTEIIVLCQRHHYLLHFLRGKKEIYKNFGAVKKLKIGLKKMTIGKMKRLKISIPMEEWNNKNSKEYALGQISKLEEI